jgi:hypothetical protein
MATHPTTPRDLVNELLITRRQAQRLAISLRFQGRESAAIGAEEKVGELSDQIDRMLAAEMETWVQGAADLTARLKGINQRLSADVDSIRKRDQNVERIARALGAIDDVIRMIRRLTP